MSALAAAGGACTALPPRRPQTNNNRLACFVIFWANILFHLRLLYRVNETVMHSLDRLEGYPRLYERESIPYSFGRAWIYLYRGCIRNRSVVHSGDWRCQRPTTGTGASC